MTWAAAQTAIADAAVATFGEAVGLPGGVTVTGIVDLPVLPAELRERGSARGAPLGVAHQAMPRVHLREGDAATLREGDAAILRGQTYLVVALAPDGYGETALDLVLPGAELTAAPGLQRWR